MGSNALPPRWGLAIFLDRLPGVRPFRPSPLAIIGRPFGAESQQASAVFPFRRPRAALPPSLWPGRPPGMKPAILMQSGGALHSSSAGAQQVILWRRARLARLL